MRNLLILLTLVVFSTFLVSAQESEPIEILGKSGTVIDLQMFCQETSGKDCESTAVCNLTLKTPLEEILINNQQTTNQLSYHNYTLNETQTELVGEYIGKLVCIDPPGEGVQEVILTLTPSGTSPNNTQGQVYIALLVAGIILFVVSLIGTIKIKWGNVRDSDGFVLNLSYLKYLKLFLFFTTYLLLIFINWTIWKMGDFLLWFDLGHKFFITFFWILVGGLVPVFFVTIMIFWTAIVNDKEISSLLKGGFTAR